jgi:hypothetical protein
MDAHCFLMHEQLTPRAIVLLPRDAPSAHALSNARSSAHTHTHTHSCNCSTHIRQPSRGLHTRASHAPSPLLRLSLLGGGHATADGFSSFRLRFSHCRRRPAQCSGRPRRGCRCLLTRSTPCSSEPQHVCQALLLLLMQ